MAWKLKVTKKNVDRMETVAAAMRTHLQKVLLKIREYPLEVYFEEGYRVVFEKEEDVLSFIDYLDAQVLAVRQAA